MNKNIIISATVALVVGAIVGLVIAGQANQSTLVGGVQDRELSVSNFQVNTSGAMTQGGGILRISQSGAARTLTDAEMFANGEIVIDSVSGAAALALTLPTASSMKLTIPQKGQTKTWIIQNNHTAAATTTTITTNTGINLQGDTANDDVINGAVTGTLTCHREYDLTVLCLVSEKVNAE
jgi:hypothetical protein